MADSEDPEHEVDETERELSPDKIDPHVMAAALAARVREARELPAG